MKIYRKAEVRDAYMDRDGKIAWVKGLSAPERLTWYVLREMLRPPQGGSVTMGYGDVKMDEDGQPLLDKFDNPVRENYVTYHAPFTKTKVDM